MGHHTVLMAAKRQQRGREKHQGGGVHAGDPRDTKGTRGNNRQKEDWSGP